MKNEKIELTAGVKIQYLPGRYAVTMTISNSNDPTQSHTLGATFLLNRKKRLITLCTGTILSSLQKKMKRNWRHKLEIKTIRICNQDIEMDFVILIMRRGKDK